ncbi:MAG TPA: alpha-L-fucosidase, partial [Terriglobales bacterium]|nr:alpha-L-fucosidase [Terriglobales bacterium]
MKLLLDTLDDRSNGFTSFRMRYILVAMIRICKLALFSVWAALVPALLNLAAAQTYQPAPSNLAARRAFQDAKFGMFIHWGVYSVLEDGEWVMNTRKIPIAEYEQVPPMFDPTRYDPAQWVSLVKAAGMKYIT